MSLTEENIREKKFHNNLQSKKEGRFENIFYKAIHNLNYDFFKYLEDVTKNSEMLDYGCGIGSSIEKVIKFKPKKITGIDISEVSIKKAINKAKELEIDVEYCVDNCEKTKFKDSSTVQYDLE